jgi:ribosome biogenesis GTPase
MSREDRKLRKHFEERAKRELRLARKHTGKSDGKTQKKRSSGLLASGLVVETGAGFCDVLGGENRERCRSSGEAAVGDRVLFSTDRRRVEEVLPRRTVLSRSDPGNPHLERVIAANIDVVVNVVSLKNPPLRPGLIDRYLIATAKSGAEPLLCVNKIDLLEDSSEIEPLRPYQDMGLAVLTCSAATGRGMTELLEALAGKMCVFTGHSGVGKSSLLNALDPSLNLVAGEISSANQKGRHTTTSSALYHLPGGGMVIDTPGIREFGLWNVSANDIRGYFREFDEHHCAFADCSHIHEPDCAVKRAVEAGVIAPVRYESYLRILAAHSTEFK